MLLPSEPLPPGSSGRSRMSFYRDISSQSTVVKQRQSELRAAAAEARLLSAKSDPTDDVAAPSRFGAIRRLVATFAHLRPTTPGTPLPAGPGQAGSRHATA